MTPEQVLHTLRAIRYGRPPSLSSLAKGAGIERATLYAAINSGHLSDRTAASLARQLQGVQFVVYQNHRSRTS